MGRRAARNSEVRHPEAGYALLFVYMMAAVVAIMLYSELPRVAFEAQREKEQLLIDRGEQYSRAILLYVRKNNRFPADFDALDKTAGQRFLRHRYKDPMTGKEEWRIIHVGPGGVFTDSVLYTKKATDKKGDPQNFITELQPVGGTVADPNAQGANIGLRRRPSDQPGSVPGAENGAIPNGALTGIPNGAPNGSNGIPNGFTGQPGQPGNLQNGALQPGAANGLQLPPGVQFPPGMQPPPGYGQVPQQQVPQQGSQQPFAPNAPSPTAANLINQILTTPRPGGLNGLNGATQGAGVDQFGNPLPQGAGGANPGPGGTTPAPLQGQSIGGGIAGVASKLERDGIKIYKERKAYNEWEFVYDLSQDKILTGLGSGAPGGAVNVAVAGGATSGVAAAGQTASQTALQTTQQTAPPPPPVYTPPPVNNFEPPQPTVLPSPFPGGVPGGGPGQPGFPGIPTTQGGPGSPAFPNPGQQGSPIYPIPGTNNNVPGGIVPSPPIGGGGIVPGPPIGGGAPH